MNNVNPVSGDDEEKAIVYFRNKIERWRGERYEKLCSRLRKFKEDDGNKANFISPSILGTKCPKNLEERVIHQECKGRIERKTLGDQQHNSKCKSGKRRRLAKKLPEGPAIRQTVTSQLRALQNNPLMDKPIGNYGATVDLNGTVIRKDCDKCDIESLEAMFSTPAVGNNHPQFPDSVSVIKHVKSPTQIPHSKKFLKYD